jgi:hypothetical protein
MLSLMRFVWCVKFLLLFCFAYPQLDSALFIKVWFLYGSRPKYKYRKTEKRIFGGIHSGHVSIQLGDVDYGFSPTKKPVHIFPKSSCDRCDFFDTTIFNNPRHRPDEKTAVVIIPLRKDQYLRLDSILRLYAVATPYDYAVFGMRCSSSAYDVLSQIGLFKKKKRFANMITTFYPRRMRKRIYKMACKNNYTITLTPGRKTRVWEKDHLRCF